MNKNTFIEMITNGRNYNVTDIHLSAEEHPIFRVNNILYRVTEYEILSKEGLEILTKELLTLKEYDNLRENKELDLSFEAETGNCRINIFYEKDNISYAIRVIKKDPPTIEELNLSAKINDFYGETQGLIIICGKSGSGKSSTASAMIDKYNELDSYNIITIEDPIETIHKNKSSIMRQREVGRDVKNYSLGIKSALRQNADIILIGELKDGESIENALMGAETGHIVLSTLYANGIVDAIERLIDSFSTERKEIAQKLVGSNLLGVIYQDFTEGVGSKGEAIVVPICEMLHINPAISSLIKNGKLNQISSFLDVSGRKGTINRLESVKELYRKGRLSQEQFDKEIKNLRKA